MQRFQDLGRGESIVSTFERISLELNKIWNYSSMPVYLDKNIFSELSKANQLALEIISSQYREGHYENISHGFTRQVSSLDDPEISVVPFRIDYLRKGGNGTFAMYDLNTQPGIPGSYFWEEFWRTSGSDELVINGHNYDYFRVFPELGKAFNKITGDNPSVAVFQEPDPYMNERTIQGLSAICGKTSSYGYYGTEFVLDKNMLGNYDIIEPFYFIRGDLTKMFSNYRIALDSGKPLGSNLKLEPYTSKDMVFARNPESYLDAEDSLFLKDRIAEVSDNPGVKKRLYGMSGTGYYDGNDEVPWSGELVNQEILYPESCLVSKDGAVQKMMYDIGITSLMVFRGNEMTDFQPVVDITIRAGNEHPISGPDTNIVPGAVCQ